MKRFFISMLLCLTLAVPGMAEEAPSPTDEFLSNLSATWSSFVSMTEEAANNVTQWINGIELPDWAEQARQSIEGWYNESGLSEWTQEASEEFQVFIRENRPAVEAWLSQAGEEVAKAWNTLANPSGATKKQLERAYNTVIEAMKDDEK